MSRSDRFSLGLSLLTVLVSYWVANRVFENMPHLEDEMAYVWQAQVIAKGQLITPVPPGENSFLVPFVVDYNGHRFGKYPLGWPVVLALGVASGLRDWVNPLLAGLGVWMTYRLGKRVFSEIVGLLAAVLTLTSPFFLINAGSLLSHPLGLVLSAVFVLAWLDAFTEPVNPRRWFPGLVAGSTLGGLALTRPYTALAVAVPFGLHGLYLLIRGNWDERKWVLLVGIVGGLISLLHPLWQYAVTGDPFLNPYVLWWSYDRIGFGPGVGHNPAGHSLWQAWINTRSSLRSGVVDLFGWGHFSWILLPVGLWATLRNPRGLLLASVFPSLLIFYLAYWVGASLFGPRYYFEGLFSLTLLSGAGIAWLAGWSYRPGSPPVQLRWRRGRLFLVTLALTLLITVNLVYYLPLRVGGMHGLYGIQRARMAPFQVSDARQYTPALIIVHPKKWTEYGTLLELTNPFLDTPFLFVVSRSTTVNAEVAAAFPERKVFHYYPDEPGRLYTAPRPLASPND